MEVYPKEVRSQPQLLVALLGAKQVHAQLTEALHEAAVAACGQRRVRYLSLGYTVEFPPCKRGAKDSPGYRVEGLVKRSWLEKVCNQVPAVLVVCLDWTSEVSPKPEEEQRAVAHLQAAHRAAQARGLRVLSFLLLHASADPEIVCSTLRQQPEASGLVVAKGAGEVATKAQKLEKLVFQNAVAHYTDEEKRQRRELSPRPGAPVRSTRIQNALQVRANFKAGFLAEFRRDTRAALKSYIKAYEALIHEEDIADVVERMALCNHITLRMYQLYLLSHDVSAAVHHCRIQTATLRSCGGVDDVTLAWRKPHWLAANHQLFAELLESVAQQMPLLIDPADLWQFSGFHYQSAADYVGQLQRWATWAGSEDRLQAPSSTGGALQTAPYLGQPETLETPSECSSPAREVALRLAHNQAFEAGHGDRALQLLARSHGAYKERGFTGGVAACGVRMAEEYLSRGDLEAATKLYERLRAEPQQPSKPRPVWPSLRRFALQRAIACSLQRLGVQEMPLFLSADASRVPATAGAGKADDQGEESFQAVCRSLVRDSLALLPLLRVDSATQLITVLREAVRCHWVTEAAAGEGSSTSAPSLEVDLDAAGGWYELQEVDAACAELAVLLRHHLVVPLEVSAAVASTASGVQASLDQVRSSPMVAWPPQQDLQLRCAWPPKGVAAAAVAEDGIASIRFCWDAVPGVALIVRGLQRGSACSSQEAGALGRAPLLAPFRPPFLGASVPSWAAFASGGSRNALGGPAAAGGPGKSGAAQGSSTGSISRLELIKPIDPSTAIAAEQFVVHVAVVLRPPKKPPAAGGPLKLLLSCSAAAQATEEAGKKTPIVPSISLISTAEVGEAPAAGGEWQLIPLSLGSEKQLGELGEDGWRPAGDVLSLPSASFPSQAAGAASGIPAVPRAEDEELLVVPVAVCCRCPCQAIVSVQLKLRGADGAGAASAVAAAGMKCEAQLSLQFGAALQLTFEDRFPGSGGVARPAPSATRTAAALLPRRFTLKAFGPAALQLEAVGIGPSPTDAAGGEGGGSSCSRAPGTTQPALGRLGRIAPNSTHAFAIAPAPLADQAGTASAGASASNASRLVVRFSRCLVDSDCPGAAEHSSAAFFPWDGCQKALPAGRLPAAAVEWLVPPSPRTVAAAAAAAAEAAGADVPLGEGGATAVPPQLEVDLVHPATAVVAEPIEVRVRVSRAHADAAHGQEVRLRLMLGEGSDKSEKYFISGTTITQALLLPSADGAAASEPQVCMTFLLIPLRPGWLTLPRAAVSSSAPSPGEATSLPSSVFVFPSSGQPASWRIAA